MSALTVKEKISYGLGDTACNFVWQTVMLFLAYFYTDIYGLSAMHMGTMFLAVRIIDAVTDPLLGSIVDRTRTKHGQFRPYIRWFSLPFGLACVMVFYTPDLGYTGKVIYAYASYIFLTLMYTAVNVPYCAMANALSEDSQERTSLQSYRFALSTMAGIVVAFATLPLVELIGAGNKQVGYLGAMSVMTILSMILFYLCFKNTTERNTPAVDESNNVKQDLLLLAKNKEWRVLFGLNIVLLFGVLLKASTGMYFINNILQRPDLATFLMVLGMVASVIGAMISAPFYKKLNVDKTVAYKYATCAAGLLSILMFFVEPDNITMIVLLTIAIGVIQMSTTPLLWSMISDVVDHEQARSGRKISGLVFSTILFAIKFGIAIGGAAVGWILGAAGYIGGAEAQGEQALLWITLLHTVLPGLVYISLALILSFYGLNRQAIKQIAHQLKLANA